MRSVEVVEEWLVQNPQLVSVRRIRTGACPLIDIGAIVYGPVVNLHALAAMDVNNVIYVVEVPPARR